MNSLKTESDTEMKDVMILILDGHHGVYIPQMFIKNCTPESGWFIDEEDSKAILDEDNDYMLDAWYNILDNAYWQATNEMGPHGPKYFLHQDDDLWAIHEDYYVDEFGQLHNTKTGERVEP